MEEVADHDWLEYVQLKVALGGGKGSSDLVAEDLGADHSQRLALSGVDLSRHDGGAGLVLWKLELAQTASWARAEEADVLCDLEEGCSERV